MVSVAVSVAVTVAVAVAVAVAVIAVAAHHIIRIISSRGGIIDVAIEGRGVEALIKLPSIMLSLLSSELAHQLLLL